MRSVEAVFEAELTFLEEEEADKAEAGEGDGFFGKTRREKILREKEILGGALLEEAGERISPYFGYGDDWESVSWTKEGDIYDILTKNPELSENLEETGEKGFFAPFGAEKGIFMSEDGGLYREGAFERGYFEDDENSPAASRGDGKPDLSYFLADNGFSEKMGEEKEAAVLTRDETERLLEKSAPYERETRNVRIEVVNNNSVNSGADIDSILDALTERLEDMMSREADGLYI